MLLRMTLLLTTLPLLMMLPPLTTLLLMTLLPRLRANRSGKKLSVSAFCSAGNSYHLGQTINGLSLFLSASPCSRLQRADLLGQLQIFLL